MNFVDYSVKCSVVCGEEGVAMRVAIENTDYTDCTEMAR